MAITGLPAIFTSNGISPPIRNRDCRSQRRSARRHTGIHRITSGDDDAVAGLHLLLFAAGTISWVPRRRGNGGGTGCRAATGSARERRSKKCFIGVLLHFPLFGGTCAEVIHHHPAGGGNVQGMLPAPASESGRACRKTRRAGATPSTSFPKTTQTGNRGVQSKRSTERTVVSMIANS